MMRIENNCVVVCAGYDDGFNAKMYLMCPCPSSFVHHHLHSVKRADRRGKERIFVYSKCL